MNLQRNILFACLFLLYFVSLKAQTPDEKLEAWHQENPIEKVYLHLDRQDYFAGQTCWFKSYFISDFQPSARNSTLFVELLNTTGELINKKVLPVFNGITYGQIDLPDTLSTGTYQLRAYSPLMLNHDKDFLYSTAIRLYGKSSKNKPTVAGNVQLRFFPEGGILLTGVENTVAFKATNTSGLPVNFKALIKDDSGNTITPIKSMHDGMGKFAFTPIEGRTYVALLDGREFPLPEASREGVALQISQNEKGFLYQLQSVGGDRFRPVYVIGQMQHKVVFKQAIDASLKGSIATDKLPSGVLQCTFFNKDGIPLAERLVFIDNQEYLVKASLQKEKIDLRPRRKNELSIHFAEPVEGNFSVAVTDNDFNEPGLRKENIISSLLLTSDIPGYVHHPAFYFSNHPAAKDALDLVMLTNGWRRFTWKQVADNNLPKPQYNDPGYISLSGKVNVRGSKKSFADRDLLVWVATSDSGRALQMVKTDAEGRFKMDSVVFFDKAKILFTDVMGKKSQFITVQLNTDSLYQSYNLPLLQRPPAVNTNTSLINNMQQAFNSYTRGSGTLLDNVYIEGRRLTLEELEKKYMSALFAGNLNARTINLTGQFIPQFNIFEWLMGRVPNLIVQRNGQFMDNYRLFFRRQPVQLFLDEMPMQDASIISTIPANQIALIKIFPQFIGARGNGPAVAIYTKRGEDLNEAIESTGDIVDYDGYSIIKEFYSPDYSTPPEVNYVDHRLTLTWMPEVGIGGASSSIPIHFYNTDRTKKLKVVAEGVTHDGKLLMLEETIE